MFIFVVYCSVDGIPCGGDIFTSSGWLSSIDRDGDGLYDDDRDCRWVLHAPGDLAIKIQVLYLYIEYEEDCYYDYLTVKY